MAAVMKMVEALGYGNAAPSAPPTVPPTQPTSAPPTGPPSTAPPTIPPTTAPPTTAPPTTPPTSPPSSQYPPPDCSQLPGGTTCVSDSSYIICPTNIVQNCQFGSCVDIAPGAATCM